MVYAKKTPPKNQMVAWIVLLQIGHSISLSNSTDTRCGGYKEKLYMYFYFYPIFPTDLSMEDLPQLTSVRLKYYQVSDMVLSFSVSSAADLFLVLNHVENAFLII